METKLKQDIEVTDDELGSEMINHMVKQLSEELAGHKKNIERSKADYENYKIQWDIEDELYRMQLEGDNVEYVNPERNMHKNPRFWELQKKIIGFKYREEKHKAEQYLQGLLNNIKASEEQVTTIQAQLDKYGEKHD